VQVEHALTVVGFSRDQRYDPFNNHLPVLLSLVVHFTSGREVRGFILFAYFISGILINMLPSLLALLILRFIIHYCNCWCCSYCY
jgi:hypothetical protein